MRLVSFDINKRITIHRTIIFSLELAIKNIILNILQSSPPPFSPKGRSNDLDAILHCIAKAEKFIYISVMDYFPLTIYTAQAKYV